MDWHTWRFRYGAAALFSAAAVLLISLGAWWFVFLGDAVTREHDLQVAFACNTARIAALQELANGKVAVEQRTVAKGWIEEGWVKIGPLSQPLPRCAWLLDGAVPPASAADVGRLAAWPTRLKVIDDHHTRRRSMVYGEGGLLCTLLVAVLAMLWRLIRSEARFRREMQDFLGRVTHEMKTPLAGIKAVLQTIESGRMPQEQMKPLAGMALREVEREEHLVQNLLLAQKMRLPDQALAKDPVDLAALLAKFVRHRQEAMSPLQFKLNCAPGVRVLGDPTAIWTVLENLTDNAGKYGARQLQIRTSTNELAVSVAVRDDGQGFEAGQGPQLFDAFVRKGGPLLSGHGTGLGLHLSRQLARRMGGDLVATSQGHGKGAEFVLSLPSVGG